MHTKQNPTMASSASPSAADPKMADLCNHTRHRHLHPMDAQRMANQRGGGGGGCESPPLKTVDFIYYYHSDFSHKIMCDPLALSLKVVISLNFILYQRVIPVKTEMKALPWGYLHETDPLLTSSMLRASFK